MEGGVDERARHEVSERGGSREVQDDERERHPRVLARGAHGHRRCEPGVDVAMRGGQRGACSFEEIEHLGLLELTVRPSASSSPMTSRTRLKSR